MVDKKKTKINMDLKIIILAAGIGSRLGNPFPKPLTLLKDGDSIMSKQLKY